MATARELARNLCDEASEVSLIYVHASGDDTATDLLYRRVCDVARRHAGVELVALHAAEAPAALSGPGGASVLFVMRRGELFGQAAGPLPTSELDRVVKTALRWS